VQADTIVPGAGNPAAWDRYAYVMYNPVKYTDPTGHFSQEQLEEWFGETWFEVLEEEFPELLPYFQTEEMTLGNMIYYEINGEKKYGVFSINFDNELVLWDPFEKDFVLFSDFFSSDFMPISLYDQSSEGIFDKVKDFGDYQACENIHFLPGWNKGDDYEAGWN
jgi:hypothetical protein